MVARVILLIQGAFSLPSLILFFGLWGTGEPRLTALVALSAATSLALGGLGIALGRRGRWTRITILAIEGLLALSTFLIELFDNSLDGDTFTRVVMPLTVIALLAPRTAARWCDRRRVHERAT